MESNSCQEYTCDNDDAAAADDDDDSGGGDDYEEVLTDIQLKEGLNSCNF